MSYIFENQIEEIKETPYSAHVTSLFQLCYWISYDLWNKNFYTGSQVLYNNTSINGTEGLKYLKVKFLHVRKLNWTFLF